MSTMNIYETTAMMEVLRYAFPARKFLTSTFFNKEEYSLTENVQIDIIKGKRRLAPFVSPLLEAKTIEKIGYKTNIIKPPYLKPKTITTAQEFLKRKPGEHVYQDGKSSSVRAIEKMAEDFLELQQMIERRIEWMAAQVMHDGKVQCTGDGINVEIDFGLPADHQLDRVTTASQRWTEATSDPIKDLKDLCIKIVQDSGIVPTKAIFGQEMLNACYKHSDFMKLMDNRRVELGQIKPEQLPDGVVYVGHLNDPYLDIFTYNEWYIDESSGVEEPMINPKMVLVGSTNARTAVHYGAIQDLEGPTYSIKWFPKSWVVPDPSVRFVMLQSAPVVAPYQIDAFGTITGIAP